MKVVERIPESRGVKTETQMMREKEVLDFIKTGARYAEAEIIKKSADIERTNYNRAVNSVMHDNGLAGFEIIVSMRNNRIYLQRR